jgi:hypothetical protein
MRRWLASNVLFRLQEGAKGHTTLRTLRDMEVADRLGEQLQAIWLREFLDYVHYVRRRLQEAEITPSQMGEPRDLQLVFNQITVKMPRSTFRGLDPFAVCSLGWDFEYLTSIRHERLGKFRHIVSEARAGHANELKS